MSLRQSMNQNSRLTVGVLIVVILAGLSFIVWYALAPEPEFDGSADGVQLYFTSDDGKTLSPASVLKQYEDFILNGQPAVVAHIFECEATKERFVGYLEFYTPEAKAAIRKASDSAKAGSPLGHVDDVVRSGRQVKRPGESRWWPIDSPAGQQITAVKCPDGKGSAVEVRP